MPSGPGLSRMDTHCSRGGTDGRHRVEGRSVENVEITEHGRGPDMITSVLMEGDLGHRWTGGPAWRWPR